jgi:hypothetical protein
MRSGSSRRPTGVKNPEGPSAAKQAAALAELTTAEAGERLVLDWSQPVRHATFYKAVFRPAVVRAIRAATVSGAKAAATTPRTHLASDPTHLREPVRRGGAERA